MTQKQKIKAIALLINKLGKEEVTRILKEIKRKVKDSPVVRNYTVVGGKRVGRNLLNFNASLKFGYNRGDRYSLSSDLRSILIWLIDFNLITAKQSRIIRESDILNTKSEETFKVAWLKRITDLQNILKFH